MAYDSPRLQYAVIAFLDILGFRDMVKEDAASSEAVHLADVIEAMGEVNVAFEAADGPDLRMFSDSIILRADLGPQEIADLLARVQELQRRLIHRGILVRGAIEYGKHFENSSTVFSDAVVLAYELEATRAQFPRVLFGEQVAAWTLEGDVAQPDVQADLRHRLIRDRDDRLFVHYLDLHTLPVHEKHLKAMRSRALGDDSILTKFQWLCDYHNFVAAAADQSMYDHGLTFQSLDI